MSRSGGGWGGLLRAAQWDNAQEWERGEGDTLGRYFIVDTQGGTESDS